MIMAWLKRIPEALYPCIVGLAVLGALWWLHTSEVKGAYQDGFAHAEAQFRATQAEADRLAAQGVIATTGQQQAISEGNAHAYDQTSDAIDARSRDLSVRHEAARAQRAAGGVNLPAAGASAGHPGEAPACDGLSWSAAHPLMTQAAKDLAQLNAVLDEVEAQDALSAEKVP